MRGVRRRGERGPAAPRQILGNKNRFRASNVAAQGRHHSKGKSRAAGAKPAFGNVGGKGVFFGNSHFFRERIMKATFLRCVGVLAVVIGGAGPLLGQTAPATGAAQKVAAPAPELAVTEADAGKTLKLGDNKVVSISLAGNATTGYSWSVTKVDGVALEQMGDIQYVPLKAPAGMVGTGGTSVVKFRAVKAGQATITLGYARPWERGTPPTKTFTVTIEVDKAP
jgi:inhibitor of cysteine peptidase